jgi:uncharacterized membrane protein
MEVKAYLKALSILHWSLVGGLALFVIFAVTKVNRFTADVNGGNIILYAVPVVALLGYFGSQLLFKKQMVGIEANASLEEKLKKFQSAAHVSYLLIEAPAFLALFAYYTSGNALPLVIAICLLLYLIAQRPSKEKIKKSLPLSASETKELY